MANEENHDDKASWTVKSMPVESRKLAVAAAARAGESMATWLDRAVRTQVKLEAGERVLPPAARPAASPPALYAPPAPAPELGELAALMGQAAALATQAGVQIPKAVARHALALTTAQLRAARGLPPLASRQTKPPNGQTILEDGSSE